MQTDEIKNNQPALQQANVSGCSFSQEQIDNRTSDYVCWDCGLQFLTDYQKQRSGVCTAHVSTCGLCQQEKSVTHIRHWNWLSKKIRVVDSSYGGLTGINDYFLSDGSLFTGRPDELTTHLDCLNSR